MIVTQSVSMVVAAALTVLTFTHGPLAAFFVFAMLGGAAVVFDAPSRQALNYQLVGRDELPNAIALNSSLQNAARVIGPAIAGVVIAAAGVGVCFGINAATFLAVLASLALMRRSELIPLDRERPRLRGTAAIREGLSYVRNHPSLRLVVLCAGVVGIAGFNVRVLIPVLTEKTLHAGPHALGVLFACFGLGALAGALVTARAERPRWRRLLAGLAGLGLAMIAIAAFPSIWIAGSLLVVVGFSFSLWSATSQSMLQLTAPDHLRGRVVSLYLLVFGGLSPIGSLLCGWLADVGGTGLAFVVAGGSVTAVTVYAGRQLWARHMAEPPPGERTTELLEQEL